MTKSKMEDGGKKTVRKNKKADIPKIEKDGDAAAREDGGAEVRENEKAEQATHRRRVYRKRK